MVHHRTYLLLQGTAIGQFLDRIIAKRCTHHGNSLEGVWRPHVRRLYSIPEKILTLGLPFLDSLASTARRTSSVKVALLQRTRTRTQVHRYVTSSFIRISRVVPRLASVSGCGRYVSHNPLEDRRRPLPTVASSTGFLARPTTTSKSRVVGDLAIAVVCSARLSIILCIREFLPPPVLSFSHNWFTCSLSAWTSCLYLSTSHSHSSLCNLTSTHVDTYLQVSIKVATFGIV